MFILKSPSQASAPPQGHGEVARHPRSHWRGEGSHGGREPRMGLQNGMSLAVTFYNAVGKLRTGAHGNPEGLFNGHRSSPIQSAVEYVLLPLFNKIPCAELIVG